MGLSRLGLQCGALGVKSYIRLASWSLVRVVRIEANGSVQVSVDEHITSARDL